MPDLLTSFKAQAGVAGILLDFDGTLSEIVEVPSEATPHAGVADALTRLAQVYRCVALVSGRSARELVQWLGPDLDVWGVHGAERSRPGGTDIVLSPIAAPFADRMSRVRDEAQQRVRSLDLPGVLVEDKRVMLALHYRAAQNQETARIALEELAGELAAEHGLWQASGRMAFELRPPVKLSKGDVVDALAREAELQAILFAGDDTVDLPGFDALDRLADEGVLAVRVGVISSEGPPELIERADLTVEGPGGMLALLEDLLHKEAS